MSATHGHSQACCNTPAVNSSGYIAKGSYSHIGGMKTYITGTEEPTKGIVSIYDIFGFFDQTIQGADILALNGYQKYKVFMPDWFNGNAVPIEWYPPDTKQKQKDLSEWFRRNAPHDVAAALPKYVSALQEANPTIKSWALIGYCWGGNVVELTTSARNNPFSISAAPHPAMIDPTGADKISVPYIMIASGEEPAEAVKEVQDRLKAPHQVEIFPDQVHGFMAARADLSDPKVKAEYARGYKLVLDFFEKNWPQDVTHSG
ncbi:hypothetical protein N0V93_002546 [Gnomoniopsis smithogilvyi]|uniref:Dienelactone hydrolase domain-containing protein n=1 Tax=Gnomoniopsis smithogilvyi TaxID=1191159 RepID=A0A9W8YWV8_9PEZI|nr:hypothetical protein N0V93_002546 [Gnomoniopsis smithogilvyi]